jgi:hypothetical protein
MTLEVLVQRQREIDRKHADRSEAAVAGAQDVAETAIAN